MSELTLEPAHKRYLVVDLAIGAAIVNLLLNMGLGWLFLRGRDGIAMTADFGEPAIAGEIFATALLLPLFTALIVTPLAKRMVAQGKLPGLSWSRSEQPWLARLPQGTLLRALVIGLMCLVVFGVPSIAILSAAGLEWLDFADYIIAKGIFSGLLAAPVTPFIGLAALADAGAEG